MDNFEQFTEYMTQTRRCVIIMHVKPDPDAMGSSLGLAAFLSGQNHQVKVIAPSEYPDFLSWLPGNEEVLAVVDDAQRKEACEHISQADVIFCLDFNALGRINDLGEAVREAHGVKVMIDHHLEPEAFARYAISDPQSASTAGLVYGLIERWKGAGVIGKDIATCLYAGILGDTGGFRHKNTRRDEFEIAASLVGAGADPFAISKKIFETNSLERLRLTGYVLKNKLTVLPEYRTSYVVLTTKELYTYNAGPGDTEGLVNYGLSVKDTVLSVLFCEQKEKIKLSFRSLGDFSVNGVARKHFNGGGHRNAAGGSSSGSLKEAVDQFLGCLPDYKEELLNVQF